MDFVERFMAASKHVKAMEDFPPTYHANSSKFTQIIPDYISPQNIQAKIDNWDRTEANLISVRNKQAELKVQAELKAQAHQAALQNTISQMSPALRSIHYQSNSFLGRKLW
jgi:hypothetical protein